MYPLQKDVGSNTQCYSKIGAYNGDGVQLERPCDWRGVDWRGRRIGVCVRLDWRGRRIGEGVR